MIRDYFHGDDYCECNHVKHDGVCGALMWDGLDGVSECGCGEYRFSRAITDRVAAFKPFIGTVRR